MNLLSKFMSVGAATMLSRMLGFVREALIAAVLGVGPVSDAFYAAFRFPNLFRRLFAEGAFNAAFVPLFAKELEGNGAEGARRFSEEVFGILFSVLLILTIAMELAMPFLVRTIIAPGFADDPDKFALTVRLAIIMFPYLICMSLAAMMSGILNSLHKYFVAAIAPVFFNVILITILAAALYGGTPALSVADRMAWGVVAAGLLQLLIVAYAVRKAGLRIGLRRPRLTKSVKRLLWLALPAAITGGITQINLVIGQIIASSKDGAISVLQYADRVYQLPLGVVGIAVGVVLLPELARALKAGHGNQARTLQNRSVEFALFLTLPATAALLIISGPIVRLLYERGAFVAETTEIVGGVLAIFAIGLPAFVLIKVFTPGFFAREDTRTPMMFAGVSVVINIALALLLFPTMGERGIATAEICSGWTNATLLFLTLVRRRHWEFDSGTLTRVPRLVLAAGLMALGLYFTLPYAAPYLRPDTPLLAQLAAVLVLLSGSFVLYLAIAFGIGGADLAALKGGLKRKPRASG
ncbi:murein biosynthesis integral membrane protein MurJ [Pseudohoeflea coraliihabitans]|uniref:Probable lipid II flippase MurJ n=1 Tax=Pseudohoeflea coraliihabitans TaxID=2860393 RepID=A0ABS6WNY6_9HYPH|nr:murein biosynthesis integral membrane protein MurJ [Pseudohoeflea sp. DP4N28-3]MBW3097663.1 murein biosynthesis integral membrane protein MurJ [Pseudohoeflea sp. DP4N28-3]